MLVIREERCLRLLGETAVVFCAHDFNQVQHGDEVSFESPLELLRLQIWDFQQESNPLREEELVVQGQIGVLFEAFEDELENGTVRCDFAGVVTRLALTNEFLKEPVAHKVCEKVRFRLHDILDEELLLFGDCGKLDFLLLLLGLGVLRGEATDLDRLDHRLKHIENSLIGDVMLTDGLHVLAQQVLFEQTSSLKRGRS